MFFLRKKLLHPDVILALDAIPGSLHTKGYVQLLYAKALEMCKQASSKFQPILLDNIQPDDFIAFLLTLSKTSVSEYCRSYGDCRSGLINLLVACEVTPRKEFLSKLSKSLKGLKGRAAAVRGLKGANLGSVKIP
jgi:hypothetical protein